MLKPVMSGLPNFTETKVTSSKACCFRPTVQSPKILFIYIDVMLQLTFPRGKNNIKYNVLFSLPICPKPKDIGLLARGRLSHNNVMNYCICISKFPWANAWSFALIGNLADKIV